MLPRWTLLLAWILKTVYSQDTNSPPISFSLIAQWQSIAIPGNTMPLVCMANGQPQPVYSVLKDSQYLETDTRETSRRIGPITRRDAGTYQCVAKNALGSLRSKEMVLKVVYMSDFAPTSTDAASVDAGSSYTIRLPEISCHPPLSPSTVSWWQGQFKVSDDRYYVSLNFHLVILEARAQDSGLEFHATVRNVYGAQSDSLKTSPKFTLHVLGSDGSNKAPEFVIPPADTSVTADTGFPAVFECVINAKPISSLQISWFRRQGSARTALTTGAKYYSEYNGKRLTIRNPSRDDAGMYECEGRLALPGGRTYPAVTRAANLTVMVAPSITSFQDSKTKGDYGDDIVVPCKTAGVPKPVVRWYKNAEPIDFDQQGNRMSQQTDGSLKIVRVEPRDGGVYQCFAKNDAGEVDYATWLTVLSLEASIVRAPQDQTVITGQDIRLVCESQGAPKPTLTWKRLNNAGEASLASEGRFTILPSGELVISQAETADSGTYICSVANNKGKDSKSAIVQVSIRTTIDKPPQDTNVIMGSKAVLNCGVQSSVGVNPTVSWFLENQPISDPRMQVMPDGTLEIESVRTSDIGTYTCKVTSVAGNDTKSADLKVVELPYPPSGVQAKLNPQSDQKVDITWNPGFDGHSPVRYYIVQYRLVPPGQDLGPSEGWVTLATDISNATRIYTVTNLKPANTYQFHVSAVNGVGEGQASMPSGAITLPQQAPSGPPRGVVASPRSNSSILVQWNPPQDDQWNGPLQGYKIRYKPYGYPSNTFQYKDVQYPTQIIELKNLIVFQEYTVEVAAFNAKGAGVFSNSFRVRTKEGHPTSAPRIVKAEARNSTSVKVRFNPPNPQRINGINQGYKLFARFGDEVVQAIVPPDPANMYGQQLGCIRHLKKYTEYIITVVCYTSAGDGPPSDAMVVRTLEDTPDQVENMRFEEVYDTSLKVVWDPPKNINGMLLGYSLIYGLKNQTSGQLTKMLNADVTHFKITGLTEQTVYTITVYARTRKGPGVRQTSDIKSGQKPELPGPPTSLALSNFQARSVVLQFLPGYAGKTTILKWVVEAQIGSATEWEYIYEEKAPNARSLIVDKLHPFTMYSLRMYAVNVVGRSNYSRPTSKFQTIQDVPSVAPGNVTVRAINETAVTVRWTPLPKADWNGEPFGYKIEYTDESQTERQKAVLRNSNGNGMVLTQLEEWTTYNVRILAYNAVGDGPYSPIARATTREAAPSAGPAAVNATAESSSSIQVKWSNVPLQHRNGAILGYKILYGSVEINQPKLTQTVLGNRTKTAFLRNLRKFVTYEIQVLAYTNIGDGVPSPTVPISVQTFQDVPGPPSGIYFPYVTYTRAKVVWSPPLEPNGVITGYSVVYREQNQAMNSDNLDDTLDASRREYTVTGLLEQRTYVFTLRAKTAVAGWGVPVDVLVKTILKRRRPSAPSMPSIGRSEISSRHVTLSWQPGDDGYSPVRNYTVQYSTDSGLTWNNHADKVPAGYNSYTVADLKPDTAYKFRVAASNDIGMGQFSPATGGIRTKEDVPELAPLQMTITPITTSSVRVQWQAPSVETWNGALLGYRLHYRQVGQSDYQSLTTPRTDANLTKLVEGVNYEVKVSAYNSRGEGPETTPQTVYVGEAIPAAPPKAVEVGVVKGTEVVLSWQPPSVEEQNGALLGYKVFYWIVIVSDGVPRVKRAVHIPAHAKMIAVTSSETQIKLDGLRMFTKYNAVIAAFNPAGDGPNSTVITFTTKEGLPEAPGNLTFNDILMTSVNVTWAPPANPNGRILNYKITYKPLQDTSGVSFTVSAPVDGDRHYYVAEGLSEKRPYLFNVTARTNVGWGQASTGTVTTGPQKNSPGAPGRPKLMTYSSSLELVWARADGRGAPITGHLVEALATNSSWSMILRTLGPQREAILPFSSLKSKTDYYFRVRAINERGVSPASPQSELYTTPVSELKPIYEEVWFLIIVALVATIIIIITVFVFMLLGRSRRAKDKQKSLGPGPSIDEGGFPTFELHQQRQNAGPMGTMNGTIGRNGTLGKKNQTYKSPPRPSPASVTYGEDDDFKPPLPPSSRSSSISEKPSDLDSVTEPQGSDSDPEDDRYGAHGGPPHHGGPPPFVSPYLSDHKLWKNNHHPQQMAPHRQSPMHHVPGHYSAGIGNKAYSYTDSEPDSYAFSLNNGQHKYVNNHVGSRAPLPGFSSFV